MSNDVFYLNRGTLLQVGTLFKIRGEIEEVISIRFFTLSRDKRGCVVSLSSGGNLSNEEIEELIELRKIKIFNES